MLTIYELLRKFCIWKIYQTHAHTHTHTLAYTHMHTYTYTYTYTHNLHTNIYIIHDIYLQALFWANLISFMHRLWLSGLPLGVMVCDDLWLWMGWWVLICGGGVWCANLWGLMGGWWGKGYLSGTTVTQKCARISYTYLCTHFLG